MGPSPEQMAAGRICHTEMTEPEDRLMTRDVPLDGPDDHGVDDAAAQNEVIPETQGPAEEET